MGLNKVTAKFKPWRKISVIIVPDRYIEIDGYHFNWSEEGGKRIYTYVYPNNDTLCFTLIEYSNGIRIGTSVVSLPSKRIVYAKIVGKDTELKSKLLDWLKQNNVLVEKKYLIQGKVVIAFSKKDAIKKFKEGIK